jgi:hypothetical protein
MQALVIFLAITIVLDSILYPILVHFKDKSEGLLWKDTLAVIWMIARGLNIINLTLVFAWLLKDYTKI